MASSAVDPETASVLDRISCLEASRAGLDDKAAARVFVPGGLTASKPPRPGSVFFLVRDRNALRSELARDIDKLKRQLPQQPESAK